MKENESLHTIANFCQNNIDHFTKIRNQLKAENLHINKEAIAYYNGLIGGLMEAQEKCWILNAAEKLCA